jgi:hypothetical protein
MFPVGGANTVVSDKREEIISREHRVVRRRRRIAAISRLRNLIRQDVSQ